MENLLDSDWLRAVQLQCKKCNTSANYVILEYDWLKNNMTFLSQ